MKNKKIILILIVFCCISVIVLLLKRNDAQKVEECRYCTLRNYTINGTIDNMLLKGNNSKNVKDLVWDVSANQKEGATDDENKHLIDDCLARLFKKVKYTVEIADQNIVEFKHDKFIPKNKGITTAKIRISVNMKEDYLCGPPPRFEDTIDLSVE